MEILLVTGPAGVGKSTLSWELSAQLAAAQVAHAVIETDELDRVFPRPGKDELDRIRPGTIDISSINLAAIWSTYQALGHTRLIMSGVMLHLNFDKRWILSAIPDAHITVVRLMAGRETLLTRLARRETGSGGDEQAQRSLAQAERDGEPGQRRPDRLANRRQIARGTGDDRSRTNGLAQPRLTKKAARRRPFEAVSRRSYRFENWKERRALALPYFLRSTVRESRVRKPPFLSTERRPGS